VWLILFAIAVFSLAGCDWVEDLYHPMDEDEPPREPIVSTLAGSTEGFTDGTGTAAQFNHPWGVAADGNGNLYVAESGNHRIRKIVIATGAVTTIAGTAVKADLGNMIGGYADGPPLSAQFNLPTGIALYGGKFYVTDYNNNRIRVITF
jgi:DNA-binding beta-propeller fold protein YncE